MFADSHAHLHAYRDVAGLLRRAADAGVDRVVGVSVDLTTARRTVEIARDQPAVVAAVVLHPSFLRALPSKAGFQALADLAAEPAVGFIGEIGLDAVEGDLAVPRQALVFRAQLDLARGLGKPVNLHLRGALDDALRIFAADGLPEAGAVFHYFTGDAALAQRLLAAGLLLSVGKPVTRPENAALRAAVQTIPLDRLLLETDAYPLPGRTTEPADLPLVAQAVAELKRCSLGTVAETTAANLQRLLGTN